jgi:hypothetical protein
LKEIGGLGSAKSRQQTFASKSSSGDKTGVLRFKPEETIANSKLEIEQREPHPK